MIAIQPPPPTPVARVTHQAVGRRAVLTVEGEIDLATTEPLAAAIDRAIAGGAADLWIDLSLTTFMDSAGLHLLLRARQRLADLNRRMAIVSPSPCVLRLFEVAGVAELLAVHPDRHTAHLAG